MEECWVWLEQECVWGQWEQLVWVSGGWDADFVVVKVYWASKNVVKKIHHF